MIQGSGSDGAGLPLVDSSLVTSLGLIEGEVLTYLEENGRAPHGQLMMRLAWPAVMITMAIGSLIRQGLIRHVPQEREKRVIQNLLDWRVEYEIYDRRAPRRNLEQVA